MIIWADPSQTALQSNLRRFDQARATYPYRKSGRSASMMQAYMGATVSRGQLVTGGAIGGAIVGLFIAWLLKGDGGTSYIAGAGIGAGVGAGIGLLRSF